MSYGIVCINYIAHTMYCIIYNYKIIISYLPISYIYYLLILYMLFQFYISYDNVQYIFNNIKHMYNLFVFILNINTYLKLQ